ncbi:MAG TPA: class I SAM-dependent methyltransferase [Desulfosporosinus sp.]|nr:class I SAM-dependent methyltransferase [Desulfosporosinus sp.]
MELQKRVEKYWTGSAQRYSEGIQNELKGFKKDAWLNLVEKYAPQKKPLAILDIGTGPGFFAIILSSLGHKVTAIDCTEEMLAYARRNADQEGVSPDFRKMDCQKLDLESNSFDLIVCRNLTWILKEPEVAYREWHRVLKPSGRLLIFDANWHLRLLDEGMQRLYEEDQKMAQELGLKNPHEKADTEESDRISRELPLSREFRPQWDFSALKESGFSNTFSENNISGKVWDDAERIIYRSTPMFLVGGEK